MFSQRTSLSPSPFSVSPSIDFCPSLSISLILSLPLPVYLSPSPNLSHSLSLSPSLSCSLSLSLRLSHFLRLSLPPSVFLSLSPISLSINIIFVFFLMQLYKAEPASSTTGGSKRSRNKHRRRPSQKLVRLSPPLPKTVRSRRQHRSHLFLRHGKPLNISAC